MKSVFNDVRDEYRFRMEDDLTQSVTWHQYSQGMQHLGANVSIADFRKLRTEVTLMWGFTGNINRLMLQALRQFEEFQGADSRYPIAV